MAIHPLYRTSLSLLTDLYQLTMAYGYWAAGREQDEAVFHLFFRKNPFQGGYTLACGLEPAIQFLEKFHFALDDLAFLRGLKNKSGSPMFPEPFLNYLAEMRFSCDVDAVAEGTPVFPNEPLIRVRGPLIQCQLVETALLNIINFQSLIATKASRIYAAAGGDSVLEFGLRRAQGIDGGVSAARAAYIGGCAATSNVLAGKCFDIPVKGTHAHSWVMSFDSEKASFDSYADAMPDNCIFLVDTYDTERGVAHAIETAQSLRARGHEINGIRLDSGDLVALSKMARQRLDEAGFPDAAIVASDGLDEYAIADLKAQGAPISVWGVGTKLATGYDQPALGGVYKLAAIKPANGAWAAKLKLSNHPAKTSIPGSLQIRRYEDENGYCRDRIFNTLTADFGDSDLVPGEPESSGSENYHDLLQPIFKAGALLYRSPETRAIREHAITELAKLPDLVTRIQGAGSYEVELESGLDQARNAMITARGGTPRQQAEAPAV